MTNNVCVSCRYFLPTRDTHYNKPCGYCGNFRMNKPRVSDDKACALFEKSEKAPEQKPP